MAVFSVIITHWNNTLPITEESGVRAVLVVFVVNQVFQKTIRSGLLIEACGAPMSKQPFDK